MGPRDGAVTGSDELVDLARHAPHRVQPVLAELKQRLETP